MIPEKSINELVEIYETLCFDAYGVLVNEHSAIEFAPELIDYLNKIGKSYFIVTNGSSRMVSETAERYQSLGLSIPSERVINSGSLLPRFYMENGLQGKKTVVLGTESSRGRPKRQVVLLLILWMMVILMWL